MILNKWRLLAAPVGVLALGLASNIPPSALLILAGFAQCMIVYSTTGHSSLLRTGIAMLVIVLLVTFAPVPDIPGPLGLLSEFMRRIEPVIGALAFFWATLAGFLIKPNQDKSGAAS